MSKQIPAGAALASVHLAVPQAGQPVASAAQGTRRGRSFLPWALTKLDDGARRSRNPRSVGQMNFFQV
jgi:hypothetical protein